MNQLETAIPDPHSGPRYEAIRAEKAALLERELNNILYDQPLAVSYSELYNVIENLCILEEDEAVHNILENILQTYLCVQVKQLVRHEDEEFLVEVQKFWENYKVKVLYIKNLYIPFVVHSVKKERRKYNIESICHNAIVVQVFRRTTVFDKMAYLFVIIDRIRDQPQCDNPDLDLIRNIVVMLVRLDLFDTFFKAMYLNKTVAYYKQERDRLLLGPTMEYFNKVQERLKQEMTMCIKCIDLQSGNDAVQAMKKVFIEEALNILLEKLKDYGLFTKGTTDDVSVVHDQLKYLPNANDELCKLFSKYINTAGRSIIYDPHNEPEMIEKLLALKERVNEIVQKSFNQASCYVEAVRVSFKKVLNLRKYRPAQLLAKYIDGLMRDKKTPEFLFDSVIVIFRYLQSKDVFEAYYKRYLAKRLLLGKSSSQDAEKSMISKLKFECGDDFTSKLEGMFKDIDLSNGLLYAFKQRGCRSKDIIDFSAQVLTFSFWPTFSKFKLELPESMVFLQNHYHTFYKLKYSGRSLDWIGSLDTCLLKARFDPGPKELCVSLHQAAVLLLFNDDSKMAFSYIYNCLGLDEKELRRTMTSLILGKVKILTLERRGQTKDEENVEISGGMGKKLEPSLNCPEDFDDDDMFAINVKFTHKLYRVKLNSLQYKDTEEEQKFTEEEVKHDRHLQLDAALVRIMKMSRTLKHTELMTKMFGVLKFPISPNDIKKRIEILIERDFLGRDPNDANTYLYVA